VAFDDSTRDSDGRGSIWLNQNAAYMTRKRRIFRIRKNPSYDIEGFNKQSLLQLTRPFQGLTRAMAIPEIGLGKPV
jgi:hypothetical protein